MQSLLYPAPSFLVPSPPPPPLVEVPLAAPSGAVSAWWLAAEEAPAPAILFLHGNGENLETMRRSGFFEAAATLGASVLAIDYPGYGRSAGRPSEAANVAAVEAALDWLGLRRPVVLAGWSLGAAVAMQAAAHRPESFDGLALLSAWTSLGDVARVHYPGWLVGLALSERYDSLGAAAAVRAPTLVVHGSDDEIIPFAHGQRLAGSFEPGAHFVAVRGASHNDLLARDEVWSALRTFVTQFRPSSPTSSKP